MPVGRTTSLPRGRGHVRPPRGAWALLLALLAASGGTSACGGAVHSVAAAARPGHPPGAAAEARPAAAAAQTHPPAAAASVLGGSAPGMLAAHLAGQLFAAAPVVVVAGADRPAAVAAAAIQARHAHAPLLLTPASAALRAEIRKLHPRAVLAVGVAGTALAAQLPGIRVVTYPAALPATSAPAPLRHVAILVHQGGTGLAVTTTAQVAGAAVIPVHGDDPRADPAAIATLAAARPRQVIAIGTSFGPAGRLAARVAVAATGVQLPGGGQVVFPLRRLVAVYGHPGAPGLGALGQQGLPASIARARMVAAPYRRLSGVPVVPTFEIIATVALASPGKDGTYSGESSVAALRPWVQRASAAGMYVVLDLQPGRASLLTQAKMYQSLLSLPNVGLALDPEWKLQSGQLPLQQIGTVGIEEINSVARWLAGFTAAHALPQKVLVLHQFRLSMIGDEHDLDTSHDDLAIVIHMDGQGSPQMKQTTWDAVTHAAPRGVFFGWKNFYVKDEPTLSPRETMAKTPAPVMISYQ